MKCTAAIHALKTAYIFEKYYARLHDRRQSHHCIEKFVPRIRLNLTANCAKTLARRSTCQNFNLPLIRLQLPEDLLTRNVTANDIGFMMISLKGFAKNGLELVSGNGVKTCL